MEMKGKRLDTGERAVVDGGKGYKYGGEPWLRSYVVKPKNPTFLLPFATVVLQQTCTP